MRLWGINIEFVRFIPQSLMLSMSIVVLAWILIYRNWSIEIYMIYMDIKLKSILFV